MFYGQKMSQNGDLNQTKSVRLKAKQKHQLQNQI